MDSDKKPRLRLLPLLLILVFVFGLTFFINTKRYDIYYAATDYIYNLKHDPTDNQTKLIDNIHIQPKYRKQIERYDIEVADKTVFREKCKNLESPVLLGCYLSTQKIYILNVTDDRLVGEIPHTLAHEFLHGVYQRITDTSEIDADLNAFYEANKVALDERLKVYGSIDQYVMHNELHSIIPTEFENLSPELENYYSKIFTNRAKIVEIYKSIESELTKRLNQIDSLKNELNSIDNEIKSLTTELDSTKAELDQLKIDMSKLNKSTQSTEYNQLVDSYNTKVPIYNSKLSQANTKIDYYNNLVKQINDLANEQNELIENIKS